MFNTGTKKVIRDLLQEKRRTFTVLLAMIIGVFAVAMMSTSKSLLDKNLTDNFLRTNPASFSLFTKDINEPAFAKLKNMESIDQLTTRRSIWIRMKKDDGTFLPVLLYVVEDMENPLISTYSLDGGAFPVGEQEILIERTGKKLEPLEVGRRLELHFPGLEEGNYTLSGFAHDAGIAPSWMEGYLYGYVSASSLPAEYLAKFPVEIKCNVAENKFDLAHIKAIAREAQAQLEEDGVVVLNSQIHEPGVHMHQKQMNALMFLILNFGILALILSGFLIINMISAIMAREVKQIAIMKSTGASSFQISRIYISTILVMALASIAVGTPLGIFAGNAFATFNASMLNFELFDRSVEPLVILMVVLAGICLPLMISLFPIVKSSRVSLQKALNDTGVENVPAQNHFITLIGRLFSGSFLLALKNAFRRRTRLALTVISLAVGGAIFITAFNIRKSTRVTVEDVFDKQPQDILYVFSEPVTEGKIDSILKNNSVHYDLGFRGQGAFVQENSLNSNTFLITAIDETAKLIKPVIDEGRWVENGKKEIVINQILKQDQKVLHVGDEVTMSIEGKNDDYTVVGICKEMFAPAGIFMAKKQYAEHLNLPQNSGNFLMIDALTENHEEIAALDAEIEKDFRSGQIDVVNSISKMSYKTAVVEHLYIIMGMLFSMTLLVILVGGMGMATSININISERIRELGILRAIGIRNKGLRGMVMTEAATMGVLSWLFSIMIAIPLTSFLGNEFFSIFFESSMNISISFHGIILWLGLAVIIGIVSSVVPANRVIKQQITSSLNYE